MKKLVMSKFGAVGMLALSFWLLPLLTKSDQNIVARTIYREACGDGEASMYGVACVIQQRAFERRLTASEVCLEPKQFSVWNDHMPWDLFPKALPKNQQADYANKLAEAIVNGKELDHSVVAFANAFCVVGSKSDRSHCPVQGVVLGHTRFYRIVRSK